MRRRYTILELLLRDGKGWNHSWVIERDFNGEMTIDELTQLAFDHGFKVKLTMRDRQLSMSIGGD